MTTRKTTTPDDELWAILLPDGSTALWDGMSHQMVKLGKSLMRAVDGMLINPDMVMALIPPRNAAQ